MTFPSIPRGLRDLMELGRWLEKLQTWAADTLARLAALDQAPVHQVSTDAVIDPSWDVVEYTGPGGHTLTLPTAKRAGVRRARPLLVMVTGNVGITLAAAAGETLNGETTQPLSFSTQQNGPVCTALYSNGDTRWLGVGSLQTSMRIRIPAAPSGMSTRVPFEVDEAGVRYAYLEVGGSSPHWHVRDALTVGGSLTISGAAVLLGAVGATLSIFGGPATARQSAITHPTGGATVDTESRAAIDTLITMLGSGKFNLHAGT